MSTPSTIAIDGLAASGKSTVAANLAQELGYLYFDTGLMYRAVTWAVLDRDVPPQDESAVSRLAEELVIEVQPDGPKDGRQYTVLVDGQDVTWKLREPAVEAHVSTIASYGRVRQALTRQQRRIARQGSIVMVGRDIGTVVLPNADLKIFMRASAEERARRRYREAQAKGEPADYEAILAAIIDRDERDRQNPVSPMMPAEDAVIVDTDGLTIDAVVSRLQRLVATQNSGPSWSEAKGML